MQANETIARNIASALLEIGAVSLNAKNPFTWTSGIKSPIYCDNRLTISYPQIRGMIADGFASLIRTRYPDAELIAGAATGGIPHAALVADRLNLPMVYVRSKPKEHGQGRMIEGVVQQGAKTIVIEDLVSTGKSSLRVAQAVRDEGGQVLAVAAIFTYEFAAATAAFREAGIALHTLSNYSTLIQCALESGRIDEESLALLKKWRDNPQLYA
jgi:orotate phosphoribosyltransferase